jgi:drug/metabolite transporter (DMT)-like permease
MYIVILVIIIRTIGDICFKMAVNKVHFNNISSIGRNIIKMVFNPFLWLGLFFGVLNMLVWCFGLKSLDLSYAYPFLSISYITVILSGKFIFKEHLDKYKITGIAFICCGAVLLFV